MKKKLLIVVAVLSIALVALAGCSGSSSSGGSTSGSSSSGSSSAKEYDLTTGNPSSDTIKAAFDTSNKKLENQIKLEGMYETKTYNDGSKAYVIHMYIDGKDYNDSVYCDVSALDSSKIPPNDTMVVAHGTWKHDPDSSNDTSFGYYVDSLERK